MPVLRPTDAFVRQRLSPERTRRPTFAERHTVRRLPWDTVVRVNAWLEVAGRTATALWIASLVSLGVGIDWEPLVEEAINSGRPVKRAVLLAIGLATLAFLLARSLLIGARWRLQRELWRRDVERLERQERPLSASTTRDSAPRR